MLTWTHYITAIKELIWGRPAIIPSPKTMTVDIKVISTNNKIVEDSILSKVDLHTDGKNIITLPTIDTPDKLQKFTDDNKSEIYEYVLSRLQHAITTNLNDIALFEYGKTKKIIKLSKFNYEPYLNRMLTYFIDVEAYENASLCRDLIRLLRNDVA